MKSCICIKICHIIKNKTKTKQETELNYKNETELIEPMLETKLN